MAQPRDVVEHLHGQGPAAQHAAAVLGHLLVPEGQLAGVATFVAQPLEQRVALCEGLVVFGQRAAVGRVDLAEGDVEVAAALARRAGNQADIFGQEQDDAQPADQVEPPLRARR